jgi:cysteinyl-tRNA synthetase
MLNDESIRAAQSTLDYFVEFARNVPAGFSAPAAAWAREHVDRFGDALRDDVNTPRALAAARELVAESYKRSDFGAWPAIVEIDRVLGLGLTEVNRAAGQESFEPQVKRLIEERAVARKARDFAQADALRVEIESRGYDVKDARDGATIYKKRN